MKAVFSLSTQVPGFELSPEHALLFSAAIAWASTHFSEVELVTDKQGLEYASALGWDVQSRTALQDFLPEEWRHIWMLPKIVAQSLQNEPFVHLDLDFWMLDQPSLQARWASLAVQSRDSLAVYRQPDTQAIMEVCGVNPATVAFNTGFILWNDMAFMRAYTDRIFFLASKVSKMGNGTLSSIVLEQALLAQMCRERAVEPLEMSPRFPAEITKNDMPHGRFVHFWGRSKKNAKWMERARARFAADFPEEYANALRGLGDL